MAVRNRTCAQCGNQFHYEIGRGKDRKYCSEKCLAEHASESFAQKAQTFQNCSVDGCGNKANRVGAVLCEKHYMRMRRNGITDRLDVVIPGCTEHSSGYLLTYAPDHPLRKSGPRVYEHRVVFYEANGEGPFRCHVCGAVVTWDDMHVDHLNDNVKDNRPENLAPACPNCNQWRGKDKADRSMKIGHGKHITAYGVTMCESDWARHLGISRAAITYRLRNGASIDEALRPRIGNSGPASKIQRAPLSDLVVIDDTRELKRDWVV